MTERRVATDSAQWKRVRKKVLRRDNYLCQVCRREVATQVDHVTPAFRLGSAREELDPGNLQAICAPCHKIKSMRERRGQVEKSDLIDAFFV
ncbi:MAG: HNH endonuclease [Methylococcales bacterium]|nr:HNH endonuclease [Methylococcales bacterium]